MEFNNILLNTMNSIDLDIKIKLHNLISSFKEEINNNFNLLLEANKIDIENKNGFQINLETINNICDLVLKETYSYGDVTLSQRNEQLNITYGKQITNIGTVCTIFNGNTYILIEMLLRNLLSNNANIFIYNNYMYGTNTYIIEITKEILRKNNLNPDMINQFITEDYQSILKNTTSIDLVVCIGNKELQSIVLEQSKTKTLISGYENFEIYIDSLEHIEFLERIMSQGLNITLYAKESLGVINEEIILVLDEDEAISMINNTGSKYSTSIFTEDTEIASKFLKEIKSNQVLVNTSPTIERFLDIKQQDLYLEKTIIYPVSNKLDGTNTQIKIEQ